MSGPQLTISFDGEPPPLEPTKPKRTPKPHHRPRADGPLLPLSTPKYLPVVGVPKIRADCPDTSKEHCKHLRCRWHLHRVDADSRAGRPGLAHVPRDARGWTVAVEGSAGQERAGTTAEPRWLELERYCTVWVERDESGTIVAVNAVREGEWDQFFGALHPGEAVEALDENRRVVAKVTIGADESVVFDRDPQAFVVQLRRVRGVPSCALDEVKAKGKMGNEAIGDAIARHRTLVAREVRGALRKACETAEEMGMEQEDFVAALMKMGEER